MFSGRYLGSLYAFSINILFFRDRCPPLIFRFRIFFVPYIIVHILGLPSPFHALPERCWYWSQQVSFCQVKGCDINNRLGRWYWTDGKLLDHRILWWTFHSCSELRKYYYVQIREGFRESIYSSGYPFTILCSSRVPSSFSTLQGPVPVAAGFS